MQIMVGLMHGEHGTIYKDVASAMTIVDGLEMMVLAGIRVFGKYTVVRIGAVDGLELTRHIHRRVLSKTLYCGINVLTKEPILLVTTKKILANNFFLNETELYIYAYIKKYKSSMNIIFSRWLVPFCGR